MKLPHILTLVGGMALSVGAVVLGTSQQPSRELQVGDAAPPFILPGSDGNTHSLADHRGKSAVVIAWFPKAFTGG